uniref:CD7 molecule n=1 Tax=Equus asinus TaxID=9793 RepID=A0A9L0INA9_EQUAS|nr:T-cell antigen CD7 [Equus asinus]
MALGLSLLPLLLALVHNLLRALTAQEVQQSPPYIIAPEESSINITCCTSGTLLGLHLKQSWPKPSNVIYYEGERKTTVDERFWGRVTFSGPRDNLTITVHHLQLADTGIYTCQAIMENIMEIQGPGTSVVVTDKLSQAVNTCWEAQLIHTALPTALAVGFFLIGLGLGAVCVLRRTQIKKLCWASDKNSVCVVYEDMSYSRRNTVSTPNPYQ